MFPSLQRGSRDEAIRNRYHGTKEDLLAEKYLDKAKKQARAAPALDSPHPSHQRAPTPLPHRARLIRELPASTLPLSGGADAS